MITGPRRTVKLARKLRSEMTLPEVLLWERLRTRPGSFKFRRQHAAGIYVLDFYCACAHLAIEVDGMAHDTIRARQADAARSTWLCSQGVATVRVPARVVLEDAGMAVARIVEVCRLRVERGSITTRLPLHHPAGGPPPPEGEE